MSVVFKEWQGLKHGCNQYLNFPACVWTVTENPKTPNVFLQVQNTEYLEKENTKTASESQAASMLYKGTYHVWA